MSEARNPSGLLDPTAHRPISPGTIRDTAREVAPSIMAATILGTAFIDKRSALNIETTLARAAQTIANLACDNVVLENLMRAFKKEADETRRDLTFIAEQTLQRTRTGYVEMIRREARDKELIAKLKAEVAYEQQRVKDEAGQRRRQFEEQVEPPITTSVFRPEAERQANIAAHKGYVVPSLGRNSSPAFARTIVIERKG